MKKKFYIQTCTCVNSCWVGFPLLGPFGTRCGGMKFLPPKGKCPLRPSDLTVLRPTWNRCCAEPRKVYFKKNAKWNKNKSHVKSSSNQTAICMIFFFSNPEIVIKTGPFWRETATQRDFPTFCSFLNLCCSHCSPHDPLRTAKIKAEQALLWASLSGRPLWNL